MSRPANGIVRAARRASEIVLGPDGRVARALPPRPSAEELRERQAAEEIVARAREEAETLVQEAMLDASRVQQDAYRTGRERGYRDGAAEARAELAGAMAVVQRAAGEAKAVRDRLLWSAERDLIEIVVTATRSIVETRAEDDPALVLDTIERALTRAGSQNVLRIRVRPEAAERVAVELAERHGDALPFQVLSDHAVDVGGCIVDTESGEIDARLDVQLDEIAAALRAAVALPEPGSGDDGD